MDLEQIKKLTWELAKSDYDFIIIDSSPGFGEDVQNVIKAADNVILVTTPNIPDVNDAAKIVEMVRKAKKNVWIVLNKKRNKDYELGTKEIEAMLGVKIISVINDDNKVPESISKGIPVVLYSAGSKSAISFKKLAAHILGEDYEPNIADRVKWFMGF